MPRPTRQEIRQLLQTLGLDQVDPNVWFRGTLNEILRASVDVGRLSSRLFRSTYDGLTHNSGVNTEQVFALSTVQPGEIRIISNMFIRFGTANIDEITVEIAEGAFARAIWNDSSGPFPLGVYIGTDNTETERFGEMTRQKIKLIGVDTPGVAANQVLQIRIRSAAAAIKTAFTNFRTDSYLAEDFPGW